MSVNSSFWKGKKVFLTGHTGFKGGWMSLWLQSMGADLYGYSLEPPTENNLFSSAKISQNMNSIIGDIRDLDFLKSNLMGINPDIVIHMAAQPLVRLSYLEPVHTYSTNIMGTVNLLEASRYASNIGAILNVTSDKCYENKEWDWGYRENEPMGGHDPYSNSKGCSELVTNAYRNSFFVDSKVGLGTARSGNVIGGGDWAEDRLIPDTLKAFQNLESVTIRNPLSIRPWQHVLEPLSGYLSLSEKLYEDGQDFSSAWNFGPREEDSKQVDWIVQEIASQWGEHASWSVDNSNNLHEANLLKLDISKAVSRLKWTPTWSIKEAVEKTVSWHKSWLSNDDIQIQSLNQINDFKI
tara:strand:- start:548 stop:1603 length:1056 start_codon:yes stop_codon:yes gene_type:complete